MIASEPFIKSWFALQRKLISGLQVGHINLRGSGVSRGRLIVTYPEGSEQKAELALAADLARRSVARLRATLRPRKRVSRCFGSPTR